jgi:hypothetical protein
MVALYQPCNVNNLKDSWNLTLGLVQVQEPKKSIIGNIHLRLQYIVM